MLAHRGLQRIFVCCVVVLLGLGVERPAFVSAALNAFEQEIMDEVFRDGMDHLPLSWNPFDWCASSNNITCVGDTITQIFWTAKDISGNLSCRIFDLPNLEVLRLDGDDLTLFYPHISIDLSKCNICSNSPLLRVIYFPIQNVHGSLPDLSACTYLETLMLSKNSITGSIPAHYWNRPSLSQLYLSENFLEGTLPSVALEKNAARPLTDLDLSKNALIGPLPNVTQLTPFFDLVLAENWFSGALPAWVFSPAIGTFHKLSVALNNFDCPDPTDVAKLLPFNQTIIEMFGFTDCFPLGNLPEGRSIQLLPQRLSGYNISTAPDWMRRVEAPSWIQLEIRGTALQIFPINPSTGEIFREEYVAFHMMSVIEGFYNQYGEGPIIYEWEINNFNVINAPPGAQTLSFSQTYPNGGNVSLILTLDKPDVAIKMTMELAGFQNIKGYNYFKLNFHMHVRAPQSRTGVDASFSSNIFNDYNFSTPLFNLNTQSGGTDLVSLLVNILTTKIYAYFSFSTAVVVDGFEDQARFRPAFYSLPFGPFRIIQQIGSQLGPREFPFDSQSWAFVSTLDFGGGFESKISYDPDFNLGLLFGGVPPAPGAPSTTPTELGIQGGAIAGIVVAAVVIGVLGTSVAVFRRRIFPYYTREKLGGVDPLAAAPAPAPTKPHSRPWKKSELPSMLGNVNT